MELHYQKLIGELVYPMVKCRPAYSFHIIKLSQFMANPAALHYEALKQVTIYIYHTIDDGIYYWWDHPNISLSPGPISTTAPDTHQFKIQPNNIIQMHGYADSDWGSCHATCNAITGAIIMLTGGAIGYKTKFHKVIALSSTEAEFVSVCELGKMILYFCSILDQLHIPQHEATTIYEDNRGALFMANTQQPYE